MVDSKESQIVYSVAINEKPKGSTSIHRDPNNKGDLKSFHLEGQDTL